MKKSSHVTGTDTAGANSRVRITYGEVWSGGPLIELVASTHRNAVDLLFWDGKEPLIASEINHDGVVYQAPALHPSIRQGVWFPSGAAEYGTVGALFWKIGPLFCQHVGFPEDSAAFATVWIFSSWFPEHFYAPPTLCVNSSNMGQTMNLFRLFAPLCRRSLGVAELSRRLPIFLGPTLLVNDPGLSDKAVASWRAANFRGVHVSGNGGALLNLFGAKAIFSLGETADSWGDDAMHLTLLPTDNEFPPLTEQEQGEIAAKFQPQLLMYRLRHLQQVPQSANPSRQPASAGFELSRKLLLYFQEEPKIVETVTPLFQSHQRELRCRR